MELKDNYAQGDYPLLPVYQNLLGAACACVCPYA